jgi:tetratricopeptide (TPR) repeat protein
VRRLLAVLLASVLGSCATAPSDPFSEALRALKRDDLLGALLAYDSVPVMHPQYPEARAGAAGIELRLRRGHELLLEGLVRRGEWRDREAADCLRRALEVWPDLPCAEALLAATEKRLDLFSAIAAAKGPEQAPGMEPVVTPRAGAERPRLDSIGREQVSDRSGDDAVSAGLVAVESQLGTGEFESAVADLMDLARRFPADPRVRTQLARVLHQRALLRYGQGSVAAAIEDWERVLAIDPNNPLVPMLLSSVRAEISSDPPTSP